MNGAGTIDASAALSDLLAGYRAPEPLSDTALARALRIKAKKGGFLVTICDGLYPLFYPSTGCPHWLWPTPEAALKVAVDCFLAQPPNPFRMGQRIIRRDHGETLYGRVNHFLPRNHLGLAVDPRGWGEWGDTNCTFQLPQGGFMGGFFRYDSLKADPESTPFTNASGEEHAQRLTAWADRIIPLLMERTS